MNNDLQGTDYNFIQFLIEYKKKQPCSSSCIDLIELINNLDYTQDEYFLFCINDKVEKVIVDNTNGIHLAKFLNKFAKINGLSEEIIFWVRRLTFALDYVVRLGSVYLSLENLADAYKINLKFLRNLLLTSNFVGTVDQYFSKNKKVDAVVTSHIFLIDSKNRVYYRSLFEKEVRIAHGLFLILSKQENFLSMQDIKIKLQKNLHLLSSNLTTNNLNSRKDLDWQLVAVLLALKSRLLVISGGPGTGKTTTVAKIILGFLISDSHISFRFCAPTGKAAKRLEIALAEQIQAWPIEMQKCFFKNHSLEVLTIHRLLGLGPTGKPFYNKENVLLYDVVIVDEASMLDQTLACYLFESLSNRARLILLGDKDQLSAVGPGGIFSELSELSILKNDTFYEIGLLLNISLTTLEKIKKKEFVYVTYDHGDEGSLVKQQIYEKRKLQLFLEQEWNNETISQSIQLQQLQPYLLLTDCCVFLEKNHRFKSSSQLGKFADAIKRGDVDVAFNCCQNVFALKKEIILSKKFFETNQVFLYLNSNSGLNLDSLIILLSNYIIYFEELFLYLQSTKNDKNLTNLFLALDQFKILCSNHKGERGSIAINRIIISYIAAVKNYIDKNHIKNLNFKKHIVSYINNLYIDELLHSDILGDLIGVPIMITENDYNLQLFNGDIGILLPASSYGVLNQPMKMAAFFPMQQENSAPNKEKNDNLLFFNEKIHTSRLSLYREFPLACLSSYEYAFAMTIHKAQGSEFQSVAVLLTEEHQIQDKENLSRELLYTAVTRARRTVSIFCSHLMMNSVIQNASKRKSALMSRLQVFFNKSK